MGRRKQYCGDCFGVELVWQSGRYWCPGCNPPPRTVDTSRPSSERDEDETKQTTDKTPAPSVREAISFTGGGIQGACHECGCAREECECPR